MPTTTFNPNLSAHLHNQILERAWIGAGRDVSSLPSKTWWEESSPIPFDLASRLNQNLIKFLRLAKAIIFKPGLNFRFFYYLIALNGKSDLFGTGTFLDSLGGRYVWLYPSTKTKSDEEVGILFDQETELASFVPDWEDLVWTQRQRWPWVPLQSILQTYLDMIDEGKITTYSDRRKESLDGVFGEFPWEIHQYTPMDVTRAVGAFNRLIDAIETRIPSSSIHKLSDRDSNFKGVSLPYSESVLEASFVEKDSFTGHFLSALPTRHVNFRYIAPGIQLQDPDEFINQPLADRRFNTLFPDLFSSKQPPSVFPFLLFRGQGQNKSPWTRPWFPDGNAEPIPSGIYIEPTEKKFNWESGNESRLLLSFSIGENGFARSSNGVPFDRARSDQLYREDLFSGYSGYLPWDSRSSYLHRVLDNWVERVERGDWVVGRDGVVGGIEKFREADTEEHWGNYFISYSDSTI